MPFANGATISDLEYQPMESCKLVLAHTGERDVIFDRCPLDFLAYLDVISASEGFEWLPSGRQLANVSKTLASLDMVVFVPLISPDDIPVQIERPPVPEPRRLASQVYAPRRRSGAAARRTPHSQGLRIPRTACAIDGNDPRIDIASPQNPDRCRVSSSRPRLVQASQQRLRGPKTITGPRFV